jgi:hypothetical protein
VGKIVDPLDLVAGISLAVDRLGHSGGCLLNCPTSPDNKRLTPMMAPRNSTVLEISLYMLG